MKSGDDMYTYIYTTNSLASDATTTINVKIHSTVKL